MTWTDGHAGDRGRARSGYTLIEMLMVILIIGVLIGVLVPVIAHAMGRGRESAERQLMTSLRVACQQFREQFGFFPPLVQDTTPAGVTTGLDNRTGPVETTGTGGLAYAPVAFLSSPDAQRRLREKRYLEGRDPGSGNPNIEPPNRLYSELSLPYYLMGVLDYQTGTPGPMDGANGPAFTGVDESGAFLRKGRTFDPFMSPDAERLKRAAANSPSVRYVDRWGNAIRYYHWLPRFVDSGPNQGELESHNVPVAVGDPTENPGLRDAQYAVVSVGPDGVGGDEDIATVRAAIGAPAAMTDAEARTSAAADNLVEVFR